MVRAARGGKPEHPNFGSGVEPQPEQQTDEIHVPRSADQREQPAEHASGNPAHSDQRVKFGLLVADAGADLPEGVPNSGQNDEIDHGKAKQNHDRDHRADRRADAGEGGQVCLDGGRSGGEKQREQDDDRGVAE